MKHLSGIIVFVVVFVAVGIAMHFALYQKPGIFVWTLEENAESGEPSLVRTTLELLPVEAAVEIAEPAGKKEEGTEKAEAEPEPVVAEEKNEKDAGAAEDPNLIYLFNGKDLGEWEITRYGGEGEVLVDEEGNLEFDFGAVMTGVNWGGEVPATSNYEISFDAMKLDGYDFFVALTFPVKDSHATFVVGGWGGGVVGISSVDDLNASENETMNIEGFLNNQWYHIRVKVTDDRIEAWIDDDQKVDLPLRDRKISLFPGDIELSVPIGIASFQTRSQYKNIQWRNLKKD